MTLKLFHNPRCSKSRAAHDMLTQNGTRFEVSLYLQTPPTTDELTRIIDLLGLSSARQLMRTNDALYKELALADIDSETALIAAMNKHPKLIERPILLSADKAAIGRPLENLNALL